jgi:hypothetical protein
MMMVSVFLLSIVTSFCMAMEHAVAMDESVSYAFERLAACQYRLRVSTPQGELILDFSPAEIRSAERPFYAYACEALHKEVVDVWPLNGKCAMNPQAYAKALFSAKILRELRDQAQVANQLGSQSAQVRLFVLDLKDSRCSYGDKQQIDMFETGVRDLLIKNVRPRNSVYNTMADNTIAFFLREGLLKASLLEKMPRDLQTFFDGRGDTHREGRAALCVLCEHSMNGFKNGYQVTVNGFTFHPDEYFELASPLQEDRREITSDALDSSMLAKSLHAKPLHTLYTPFYERLYGVEGGYYQSLRKEFAPSHSVHEVVEKKEKKLITHIVINNTCKC